MWHIATPFFKMTTPKSLYFLLYRSKITEGVDVFMEVYSVGATPSSSGQLGSSPSDVGPAESAHSSVHVDFVTDLAVVPYKQQQFVVSCSQDGVIKYWK